MVKPNKVGFTFLVGGWQKDKVQLYDCLDVGPAFEKLPVGHQAFRILQFKSNCGHMQMNFLDITLNLGTKKY